MSKAAEVALAYEKSKQIMLFGLGYLAARKPRLALRVGWQLGKYFAKTAVRDAGAVSKIIWKDLAKPVLAEDAAILSHASRMTMAEIIARGPIWGTTMLLTTGGALAQSIDNAVEWLGLDTPSSPDSPLAH